ncbi:MAG: PucR family transcriptional regulator [Velocimicrobium sp.]
MANLNKIIQRIEETFQIHVHRAINGNKRIENIQYLVTTNIDALQFQPETLYIGNYQDFYNLSLEGCILLLNCRTNSGNENGLYIYQSLDPFAVCNCIQQELFNHHKINMKKEEMFNVLQAGYGIQSIIDTARTYLKNPITICTTSFSVLALSPKTSLDNKFDLDNGKRYLKKDFIENLKDKKILQHISTYSSPIITTFEDDFEYSYLFCSIHIKHAAIGYICLRSYDHAFTEDDSVFIIELSKMLSIEMQKDDFYNDKSGLKYEYFLTDLVEQNFNSLEFINKRLAQLGQSFYQYFWVFAFTFSGQSMNHLNPNYYIDQLIGIFKHSMSFFYKGELIMLLTSKHANPFTNIDKQKFYSFLQLNRIYASISFRFEDILETYQYYNQAIFLSKNHTCVAKDRCFNYEDNYLYHLLDCSQNKFGASTLLHSDIHFLLKYDSENNTDYIDTLKAYFSNNRNALSASNYLHIHKSTFFYRIGKIADLTGFNLEDSHLLFSYEFSFYVLDYLKRKNKQENIK